MPTAALRDLLGKAATKAEGDESFRSAFLANPASTLEREYDVKFPSGFDAEGLRTSVQSRFGTQATDGTLSDDQLDSVAGGALCIVTCSCIP
jgi:hypothetical protein